MKSTVGILILVCIFSVTMHLVVDKKISIKLAVLFFVVGLFSPFVVANIDALSKLRLRGYGIELEAAKNDLKEASEIKENIKNINKEVTGIRNEVEEHREEISNIAESAQHAINLTEKASDKIIETDKKLSEASLLINKLEDAAQFMVILTAAQNDDREAFNSLSFCVNNKQSPFWKIAANAIIQIRAQFAGPIEPGYMNFTLPSGPNPNELPHPLLVQYFRTTDSLYKAHIIHLVHLREDTPKFEKMEFMINAVTTCESLTATFYAGKYFVELAQDVNLKWSPFNIKPLTQWWEENREKIKGN